MSHILYNHVHNKYYKNEDRFDEMIKFLDKYDLKRILSLYEIYLPFKTLACRNAIPKIYEFEF